MAKFIASIKATITRLVFATHGFVAIWQVTNFKQNPIFWYLCCPIVLLFFEGVFTLTIKASQEWKWFCPSVFLYLSSVVPAIWLLELDKVEKRMKNFGSNDVFNDTFDLTNVEDLKKLQKTLGTNIRLPDFQISTETWVTLIEQFLMLILIVGRWMLPKGELTRDQLSQLLLVYIGTAADIIEFFDSFKEDRVAREPLLVYLTLGIWAWSLMQFTVVLTATKSRKSRMSSGVQSRRKRTSEETGCCSIDVWAIAINLFLQDGPFLAFRLILIIHYKIVSYMNIFFTCKNTLVILLQLYRLYVVQSENRTRRQKIRRIEYINVISRPDSYGYRKCRNKRKINYEDTDDEYHREKRRKRKDRSSPSNSDNSEQIDQYEIRLKKYPDKHRKSHRDTGYSTSSSRTSSKNRKRHVSQISQSNGMRNTKNQPSEPISSSEIPSKSKSSSEDEYVKKSVTKKNEIRKRKKLRAFEWSEESGESERQLRKK